MSHLVISLLGTFQILLGSTALTAFESNKVRALLAYLAVESDRPHTRDALAALLWPDSDQSAALSSLRNALSRLRRVIGDHEANPPYLLITRETVQFNCESDSCLDAADVIHLSKCTQSDIQTRVSAVRGYRGPFLQGFSIPESVAFEEWIILWRERLEREALEGLHWLADYYEACGEYAQALEFARRQVALDPWMEESHCQVMRLLALSGQREQALRQYQSLREILARDLVVEPGESTTRLYHEILSGSFAPASSSKPTYPNNLPIQTTSFIGREKEITALTQVIRSGQIRLVTITGAGGTGKTRLALRVAEELLDDFPQGAWLVELAAVADPNLVPATVAAALNLHEAADRTFLQVIIDFIRTKHLLILLDTCEHLVGAVASLVDCILHASPEVVFLATSREILGIGGEMSFICPSLALPEPNTPDTEMNCEAVRLFAERSAIAAPAFDITEKNAALVAQVCRRVDGIPLAIELASARTRVLSIEQVAERLDQAFLLLTGGSRTALPRQQTLKATVDWSYNLLSPAERLLLLRLSIFSGGWTLEAAESVSSDEDGTSGCLGKVEILDLLSRLADKSLVLVEKGEGAPPRYRMLDTIRQYVQERLVESGEDALTQMRARHLDYFLSLAEEAEPHMRAWGMVEWLHRLELELANLRLALEESLTISVEQGLRLAAALTGFWHVRGLQLEGIEWLERLLDADTAKESIPQSSQSVSHQMVRGKALLAAGDLNQYYPGIHPQYSEQQLNQALSIFQDLGDVGQNYLLSFLFLHANTEEKCREFLDLAHKVGNKFYEAEAIAFMVPRLAHKGDLDQAQAYAEENLALRKKMRDIDGEAFALDLMAELEYIKGNPDRAIELWEASQRCFHAIGNDEFALYFSTLPARAALAQGEYQLALQLSEAMLAAGQENSSTLVVVEALGTLAWANWALKEFAWAEQRTEEILGPDWENRLQLCRGTLSLFYAYERIALSRGDYARARTYLRLSTKIAIPEQLLCIQALGITAAARGQPKPAVVLFGALSQRCPWLKNVSSPVERDEYEAALESTRAALSQADFQSAWDEGKGMTSDQLIAFAQANL